MGLYVHLHVCFACDENEGVAQLAKKHLEHLADKSGPEARWFLESLAARTGYNKGPKGGLSLWGVVGNYTRPKEFAEELTAFWLELLSGRIDGGPHDFERVIVMSETEQREAADAIEIWQEDGQLKIVEHEQLPFSWHQY